MILAGGGAALAARKAGKDPEPPPPPPPPVVEVAPAPPPPVIFDGNLPTALEKTPEGLANLSAQGCNACHYQVHDAWAGSAHAHAWGDPVFQAAVERAGDSTACKACHLPLANQHSRLADGYLDGDLARPDLKPNPLWDPALMSEGVTCAACHVRDGVVLGPRDCDSAPHPVRASQELVSPELCAACHQLTWPGADKPFYDTYGEWKASAYAAAGIRCQDCHMPLVAGPATATRAAAQAAHGLQAEPARALSVLVGVDMPEIQRGAAYPVHVRIQNTGAGHAVPTGSPFQSWTFELSLVSAAGKELAPTHQVTVGRTVEDASPWRTTADNRILPGGELSIEHAFTVSQRAAAQTATLRIRLTRGADDPIVTLREIPLPLY